MLRWAHKHFHIKTNMKLAQRQGDGKGKKKWEKNEGDKKDLAKEFALEAQKNRLEQISNQACQYCGKQSETYTYLIYFPVDK